MSARDRRSREGRPSPGEPGPCTRAATGGELIAQYERGKKGAWPSETNTLTTEGVPRDVGTADTRGRGSRPLGGMPSYSSSCEL